MFKGDLLKEDIQPLQLEDVQSLLPEESIQEELEEEDIQLLEEPH